MGERGVPDIFLIFDCYLTVSYGGSSRRINASPLLSGAIKATTVWVTSYIMGFPGEFSTMLGGTVSTLMDLPPLDALFCYRQIAFLVFVVVFLFVI